MRAIGRGTLSTTAEGPSQWEPGHCALVSGGLVSGTWTLWPGQRGSGQWDLDTVAWSLGAWSVGPKHCVLVSGGPGQWRPCERGHIGDIVRKHLVNGDVVSGGLLSENLVCGRPGQLWPGQRGLVTGPRVQDLVTWHQWGPGQWDPGQRELGQWELIIGALVCGDLVRGNLVTGACSIETWSVEA